MFNTGFHGDTLVRLTAEDGTFAESITMRQLAIDYPNTSDRFPIMATAVVSGIGLSRQLELQPGAPAYVQSMEDAEMMELIVLIKGRERKIWCAPEQKFQLVHGDYKCAKDLIESKSGLLVGIDIDPTTADPPPKTPELSYTWVVRSRMLPFKGPLYNLRIKVMWSYVLGLGLVAREPG